MRTPPARPRAQGYSFRARALQPDRPRSVAGPLDFHRAGPGRDQRRRALRPLDRDDGVTVERLARAPRTVAILHPGPMNRGVEIDSRVADGAQALILDQVTNGVAVRMAVLYLLAGGRPESTEAAKGSGAPPD